MAFAAMATKMIIKFALDAAKNAAINAAKEMPKVAAKMAQHAVKGASEGDSQSRGNQWSGYGQANNMRLTAQSNTKKKVIDPAQQQTSQMKQEKVDKDAMQKGASMALRAC